MSQYLIKTYKKAKIYLLGMSWGSVLGINAAHRYPELYYAYIGMSQVIDMKKGEEISYDFLVHKVQELGALEALKELKQIGKPPYKTNDDLRIQRKWLFKLGFAERKINSSRMYTENCTKEELDTIIKGVRFSEETLVRDLKEYNVYAITDFKIPIYICMGRYDYQTPFILAEEYLKTINAPAKQFFWFEESAHATTLEEPERFTEVLLTILNQTNN